MRSDLASRIDHTLLRPDAVAADFRRLCDEAQHHRLHAVCVNSAHVIECRALLGDSPVRVVSTVAFPLGACSRAAKAYEARQARTDGAAEIDMVCQIGDLKAGHQQRFVDDVRSVVDAADGAIVKVILETCLLSDDEKRRGALWVRDSGAAFVKTSTGFGSAGATESDVRLLRAAVGPGFGVKAAGGVRDAATADRLLAAGATRLGTSAGAAIVTDSGPADEGY